jgi:Zinc finger, C2H2 type
MQPRVCNYCWKTFSNSFNLKQHIVNVHVQSQGVTCSVCKKVVKNKWYLRKHLVTAHGAPLKRGKGGGGGTGAGVAGMFDGSAEESEENLNVVE